MMMYNTYVMVDGELSNLADVADITMPGEVM